MKRKYIVTATVMILCIAILGMAVCVLAADKEPGEQTEENFPEEKVIRNEKGDVIGIDITDASVGMEYRSIGFQQLLELEQFEEYESCGLTYDMDAKKLYFAGMEVELFEDNYENGVAIQYTPENWQEGNHSICLTTVRDAQYRLEYFEFYRLSENEDFDDILHDDKGWEEEWLDDECEIEESQDDGTAEAGSAIQEFYNRSMIAKEYADKEFQGFLDRFDSDCEILETFYGFSTSEPPTYIVGYRYSNGTNDDLRYAYKISVDDKYACTILEEGDFR